MLKHLAKSVLHNIGVVIVGFCVAYISTLLDSLWSAPKFGSPPVTVAGLVLLALGFALRTWATAYFYVRQMRVVLLEAQNTLITSGPYRFSRNPLYLGGNVFIFSGAALVLGSPTALILTAIHIPLIDRFIRREEKQLEQKFGEEWQNYKRHVRRWI